MQSMLAYQPSEKQKGFTLIELLIVVVILGILVALAVPSFDSTIRDNRVAAQTNSLISAVASARSEALRRSRMVSVCPSSDGATCGANWADGWLVYVENAAVVPGGAPVVDTVLSVGEGNDAVQVAQTVGNPWIRFTTRGLAEQAVTIEVSPATCNTGYKYNQLVFGIAGRPSTTPMTC